MSDPYSPQEYKFWQQQRLPLQADEGSPIGRALRVGNHQQAVGSFESFTGSNDAEKAAYPALGFSDGARPALPRMPSAILRHKIQRSDVVGNPKTFYRMDPIYLPPSDEPQTSSQGPNSTQDLTRVADDTVLSSDPVFRASQKRRRKLATRRAFRAQQRADVSELSVQSGQGTQIQRFASPFLAQTPGESLAYDTEAGCVSQLDYACRQQGLATPLPPETPGEDISSLVYGTQADHVDHPDYASQELGLAIPLLPEMAGEDTSGLLYGVQAGYIGRPDYACHQQGFETPFPPQTPEEDAFGLVYGVRAVYSGQPDYAGQQQGLVTTLPRQMPESDTFYGMRLSSVLPTVYPYQRRWAASQLPDQSYGTDLITLQDTNDLEEDQVYVAASNQNHGGLGSYCLTPGGDVSRTEASARIQQARPKARDLPWGCPKSKPNVRQQVVKKVKNTRWKKKKNHKDSSFQKNKVILAYTTPGGQDQSTVKLDLPRSPFHTPTVHDPGLFPPHEYARPPPIVTRDGEEEFFIRDIIDEKRVGRGYRYLVRWVGYGPEEDVWMPRSELEDTEALDIWLAKKRVD